MPACSLHSSSLAAVHGSCSLLPFLCGNGSAGARRGAGFPLALLGKMGSSGSKSVALGVCSKNSLRLQKPSCADRTVSDAWKYQEVSRYTGTDGFCYPANSSQGWLQWLTGAHNPVWHWELLVYEFQCQFHHWHSYQTSAAPEKHTGKLGLAESTARVRNVLLNRRIHLPGLRCLCVQRGWSSPRTVPGTVEGRIEDELIKMPVKYFEDKKHYGSELKPAEAGGNLFIDLSRLWIRSCYMKLWLWAMGKTSELYLELICKSSVLYLEKNCEPDSPSYIIPSKFAQTLT